VNLQDQGYRFILRPLDGRVDGRWMHPSEVKPQWLDCTDMDDARFNREVQKLRYWLELRREQ